MKAIRLKLNDRVTPLGIDDQSLRFSWNCEGGLTQTAWQIITEDWDSGKIRSSEMHAIFPQTPAPRQRVHWKLRIWDEHDQPGEWAESWFEMGLPVAQWNAEWISTGRRAGKQRLPAEYFKQNFAAHGEIKRARLYATACGAYTATLNAERLPGVLTPGTTEYPKRLYYQTYDVTGLLRKHNTLVFTLTDGWYMGKLGFLGQHNRFGNQRKLLARLEIEFADSRKDAVATNDSFSCCNDGPIRYADLKDGEIYDARMRPSYGDKPVVVKHDVTPTAAPIGMILEHERFPATLLMTPSGKKVLDFGQNLAGYVCFTAQGRPGGHQAEIRRSAGSRRILPCDAAAGGHARDPAGDRLHLQRRAAALSPGGLLLRLPLRAGGGPGRGGSCEL